MQQIQGDMTVDFLPEGQLKWRCLQEAKTLVGARQPVGNGTVSHPFTYIGNSARSAEVLSLAREIYDWVTGAASPLPEHDHDFREDCERGCPVYDDDHKT